jgi:hypothetical protein
MEWQRFQLKKFAASVGHDRFSRFAFSFGVGLGCS